MSKPELEATVGMKFLFEDQERLSAIVRPPPDGAEWYAARLAIARLSLVSGFDELLCLDQLPIHHYWYQIETVKKVLKYFGGRALLADEVGLGKTIEAGILLKEYLVRGLVRRTLILTPPSLVSQWQEELATKFFIKSVTTDELGNRQEARFWQKHKTIVASISTAKSKKYSEAVAKVEWDMVIVDEAHHLKNRSSQNWKLVNSLKKRFILLLTATPVQNNLVELYNLLTLLMPGVLKTEAQFKREYVASGDPTMPKNPDRLRSLLREVMVRNIRSVVDVKLPKRFATTISVEPSASERRLYEAITAFIKNHFHEEKGLDRLTLHTLLRKAGSSPPAAAESLEGLRERMAYPELDELVELAGSVQETEKGKRLLEIVNKAQGKVLIFGQYARTNAYVATLLAGAGIRYAEFNGSMNQAEKDEAIRQFREDVNVLVSSESGGEGRNLQFCQTIVNFDLPWNPMRIEQRIGRIHRIGQTKDIFIFNFCIKGSIEEEILHILNDKINMFELVVGEIDSVLGNLSDEKGFDDIVLQIWLRSTSGSAMREEFDALADSMIKAKDAYQETKHLDEMLFSEDLEV